MKRSLLLLILIVLPLFSVNAQVSCLEVFHLRRSIIEKPLTPFEQHLTRVLERPGYFAIFQKYDKEYGIVLKALDRVRYINSEIKNRETFIEQFVVTDGTPGLKNQIMDYQYLYRYMFYGIETLGRLGRQFSKIVPNMLALQSVRHRLSRRQKTKTEYSVLLELETMILSEIHSAMAPFKRMLVNAETPTGDLLFLEKLESAQIHNALLDLEEAYSGKPLKVSYEDLLIESLRGSGLPDFTVVSIRSKLRKRDLYPDK